MKTKSTMKRAVWAVAALASVLMAGSVSQAARFEDGPSGSGAGVAGLYDGNVFGFELSAIGGWARDPKICVAIVNKTTDRRAEGCGSVAINVHPALDVATVKGTLEGKIVQASTGRIVRSAAPITVDLTYRAFGFYQPLVTGTQSTLWLYPLDIAASKGVGLSRAAWGWGSVKSALCHRPSATSARRRGARVGATTVMCGPESSAPAFAGHIAQAYTASAGISN